MEIEELYHDLFSLMDEQCILDVNEILKLQMEDGGRRIRCFVNGGFEVPDLVRIAEYFGDDHMCVYGHENSVQELVISNNTQKKYLDDVCPKGTIQIMEVNFDIAYEK